MSLKQSFECTSVFILIDSCAELMEVNHDDEVVDTERFNISQEMEDVTLESMQPAEQEVAKRLTTPIVNTYLDTKEIAFERWMKPLRFHVVSSRYYINNVALVRLSS